ncbi:ComEA family DNA-binding protein [Phreatobacter oligotrophus]|jgi:DNA uptake protein ComE-like DNA-binding protein|uniref:Helix-hairpin-helix protein n=1 Tax=Phreatobacter oligotrophus TaxID=1122261 RepID=A0A2T4YS26_9HYPH|nr:helix-hairpin-helix domain-containing protein [Phreatobacter oligotrophus]PTM46459.1 helix-hairpin-helix protein [Phreatobacter oligotrophus]
MLKTLMLAAALGLAGTAAMAQTVTQPSTTTPTTRPAPTAPATTTPSATPAATTPAVQLIDINSATEAELRVLPGIGEARAKAIIAGRPYRGKDELVRKNILTQGVYDGIQARIIARQR